MKRALRLLPIVALAVIAVYLFARARHAKSQERVARRLGGLWNENGTPGGTVAPPEPAVAGEETGEWTGYAPIVPAARPGVPVEEPPSSWPAPGAGEGSPADVIAGAPAGEVTADEEFVATAEFARLAAEEAGPPVEEAVTAVPAGWAVPESIPPEPAVPEPDAIPSAPEPPGGLTGVAPVGPVAPVDVEVAAAIDGQADAAQDANDVLFPEALEEALSSMGQISTHSAARRSAEGYLDEGNVYFNVGQYSVAADRYGRAIAADPKLVAAYYNRANALTRAGDYETALGDYDNALVLQPNDADALNNRGMLHLYRASYDDALRDFDAALALEPGDTTVMVNRGLAYLHSGHPQEALRDFEAAAKIDLHDAAAFYGAGQAAAQLGDRQVAVRHLRRALEVDPGYAREAAADPKLVALQGDHDFVRLLRDAGAR